MEEASVPSDPAVVSGPGSDAAPVRRASRHAWVDRLAVVRVLGDMAELTTEERPDLGLRFCRPADWVVGASEAGRSVAFSDAGGTSVLQVSRVFRPAPAGEAGAAEVVTVLDAIGVAWPGTSIALDAPPVATYFMGLSHAQVQWYDGPDGRLKVIAGSTSLGTVLAAAIQGTPDWVDGDEANGILGSFLQQ